MNQGLAVQKHAEVGSPLSKYSGTPLWVLVLLMLTLVGAWSAWNLSRDYQQAMETNYRLLEVQAKHLEARISGAMRSVDLVEGSIIDDIHDHPDMSDSERFKWLDGYLRQLPETRALSIVDATGHLTAVNTFNKKYLGLEVSHREYFTFHRDAPGLSGIHVSAPYKNVEGITTTTVSQVILSKQGKFAGVVVAALESKFFAHALTVVDTDSSIGAVLIHSRGDILNSYPDPSQIGKNLLGGIAYSEHQAAKKATTRHLNITKIDQNMKLGVFQDLPETPLTIIVSRDYDDVLSDWKQSTDARIGSYIVVTLIALALLMLASRRQSSLIQAHALLRDRLEEISRLQEKLSDQAIRDVLTGLYNRRYLDETLPRDLSRAKREGYALAVVLLDLDHFKRVNDTYGHAGGDEVLKAISKVLIEGARESDVVCRYGGEEFLIALPRVSAEQAILRVQQWRNAFQSTKIRHGELSIEVTFSAGIAAYPEHGGEVDSLIAKADQALYHSKASGRNRTSSFQEMS